MKKIIFPLLLLTAYPGFAQQYDPQNAGAAAAYGTQPLANNTVPLDARSYFWDNTLKKLRPYQSTAEVLARFGDAPNYASRQGQFSVFINTGTLQPDGTFLPLGSPNQEWWFPDGVNLVQKSSVNGVASGGVVLASDVFSGAVMPARKSLASGDFLYNIIDDNTGEVVSYRQITVAPNGVAITSTNETFTDGGGTLVKYVDGILVRKLGGQYFMLTKDHLTAKDFGAKGDGITDDGAALQNAINAASLWGRTLYIPAGRYVFKQTLDLPKTYILADGSGAIGLTPASDNRYTLKMIGDGWSSTELVYQGASNGNCIQAIGGTGNLSGGGLYDMTITGDQTTTALYIYSRGGFQTSNCRFSNHNIGVLLFNSHVVPPGHVDAEGFGYTEFVVQHNSKFENCQTVLQYDRDGGGDPSFHGSGLDGAAIAGSGNYPIKILNNAGPYNAPLTFNMFLNSGQTAILQQGPGQALVNFYGHLQFEPSSDGTCTVQTGDFPVNYLGTVSSIRPLNAGKLVQTNAFTAGLTGWPQTIASSPRTSKFVYQPGTSSMLTPISNGYRTVELQLVYVSCSTPGEDGGGLVGTTYNYQALLGISDAPGGGGGNVRLIQLFSAPNSNVNPPVFTYTGGNLVISGNWSQTVNVQYNILPMTEEFISQPRAF